MNFLAGLFMAIYGLLFYLLLFFHDEIKDWIRAKTDESRARAEKIRKETEENDSSN